MPLFAQLHEQDVKCSAHCRHPDLHLVTLGQHDFHVAIHQHAAWQTHHHLSAQQFGHQGLRIVMISGNVIDNLVLDALKCLFALALDAVELAALFL